MNASFIIDDGELPPFSRRDLYVISLAGIVSATIGLLLTNPVSPTLDFAPLLNSVDIVSMTFATGLFSFLTAGILFSSQESRLYFLRRMENTGPKRVFRIRALHVLVISSLFTIVLTIVAFLKLIMLEALAYLPISFGHFAYFPSVLGASLVVSAFLAVLASSLATIIDDSRLCVGLGSASTIMIALIAGWSSHPHLYSLTRNIALLSPHNLVRGLAVQLSGYQFESDIQMVSYVGFEVSAGGLVIALLALSSVSVLLLLVGHRVLARNSLRWTVLEGMIPDNEIWSSSPSAEKVRDISRIRRGLWLQRIMTAIIIALLLVSVNTGVSTSVAQTVSSSTIVHYETPGIGETLQTGLWLIVDVDVQPPSPGLFNSLHFYFGVINWGNATGSLSFYYEILEMNSTEFNSLDESSRLKMVSSILNRTADGNLGRGRGKNLEESFGSYVCVLKIISDIDPSENIYIEVSLLIEQTGI